MLAIKQPYNVNVAAEALYMCPHTTTYVFACYYIHVLNTTVCVLSTTICVFSVLLFMCPQSYRKRLYNLNVAAEACYYYY